MAAANSIASYLVKTFVRLRAYLSEVASERQSVKAEFLAGQTLPDTV